jgi:HEAT repeat protein
MPGAQLFLAGAPLRLTWWVLIVAAAIVAFLLAVVVLRHLQWAAAARRRERVSAELDPLFAGFFASEDPTHLANELRPRFLRLDAAHRPVAAVLIAEFVAKAAPAQRPALRDLLERSGIVELGARGTRRRSPWRRALACEMLGKIGSPQSVPPLLQRLDDRRPEVRVAAVRALGDIGAAEAVPALSAAFLERRCAPTNVVNDALRKIGGEAVGPTFERGVASSDPIVRVSSCFGLAAVAATHGAAVTRLAGVLAEDADPRVRVAAAAALGIAGGGNAPSSLVAATGDPDVQVRRSAVKALGSFDDPGVPATLDVRTEDDDREVALRAAEALFGLAARPRAAVHAQARIDASSAWAVDYARTLAEVTG